MFRSLDICWVEDMRLGGRADTLCAHIWICWVWMTDVDLIGSGIIRGTRGWTLKIVLSKTRVIY